MADVQERIKKISHFFKGMQVTKVDDTDVIYVIVVFPSRWVIDDTIQEKYSVSVIDGKEEPGEFYFCANISTGFDAVFDAVDYCIQTNKEAVERAQIFQQKIEKLKEIFGNEEITIDELRGLDFTYQKKKKTTGGQKKKSPIEEIADKEIGEEK